MIKFAEVYQKISRRFGTIDEYEVLEQVKEFFDKVSLRVDIQNEYIWDWDESEWETLYEPYRKYNIGGEPISEELEERPEEFETENFDGVIGITLPNYFSKIHEVRTENRVLSIDEYNVTNNFLVIDNSFKENFDNIIIRTSIPMFPNPKVLMDSTLMFDAKIFWQTVLEDYVISRLYLMPRFFNYDLYRHFNIEYEDGLIRAKSKLKQPLRRNIGTTL